MNDPRIGTRSAAIWTSGSCLLLLLIQFIPLRAADTPTPVGSATLASASDSSGDVFHRGLREQQPPWYDRERDDWRRVTPAKAEAPEAHAPGWNVTPIAWLLIAVIAAVVLWVLWLVVRRFEFRRGRTVGSAAAKPAVALVRTIPLPGVDPSVTPESGLAAAKAAGDWDAAAIWLYALVLERCDRAGVIHLRPGATNGRYRREARSWAGGDDGHPAVASSVDAAADAFERVHFGRMPTGQTTIEQLEHQVRAALGRLPAPGGGP